MKEEGKLGETILYVSNFGVDTTLLPANRVTLFQKFEFNILYYARYPTTILMGL